MRIIKSLYYKFISHNKFAKLVGVRFGKNCIFRTKSFGSEPYLIEIGDNVETSIGVQFLTHDGSVGVLRNLYNDLSDIDLMRPIKIGNNVFIGLNTIILPGTVVEDNIIIGAGSIVRGLLEKNSVYAGVPAKKISSIESYLEKNKVFFIPTFQIASEEKHNFIKFHFGVN